MKKIITFTTTLIILHLILSNAKAANLGIGVQAWYAWWIPAWGNTEYTADPSITVKESSNLRDPDPEFMYGPMLTIGFLDRWNFSISGAFGEYNTSGVRQPTSTVTVFESMDIKKYDMDNAFSYILNRNFKIFAGIKVQGYNYRKVLYQIADTGIYRWREDKHTTYSSLGPGLGIGFSIPVTERLFILWNNNALMLFAKEKTSMVKYKFTPTTSIETYSYDGKAMMYGLNSILSFAYLIPDSHLSITLGFRYQFLYYKQDKSDVGEYYFDGKTDKFYGIVMSALYSFDI
jgi:hypothetical protein